MEAAAAAAVAVSLDAIASPSTYPCQSVSGSVGQSVIDSFKLEIAIACFLCCYRKSTAGTDGYPKVLVCQITAHTPLRKFYYLIEL